jgi:hypothetical protein
MLAATWAGRNLHNTTEQYQTLTFLVRWNISGGTMEKNNKHVYLDNCSPQERNQNALCFVQDTRYIGELC